MNEVIQPVFPSSLFDWNHETKIASSCVPILLDHFKKDATKSKKRLVLDIDGIMWIKSIETNKIITCKMDVDLTMKKSYVFHVDETTDEGMQQWKIVINVLDVEAALT